MKQKMNFTNNQTAFEYAIYMMVGSYFNKAVCSSKLQEKNMYLQYKEQKRESQYLMEDICLEYLEKNLINQVPSDLWNEKVVVRFVQHEEDTHREVQFLSEKYVLRVMGHFKGRHTKMTHEIWKKESEMVPSKEIKEKYTQIENSTIEKNIKKMKKSACNELKIAI